MRVSIGLATAASLVASSLAGTATLAQPSSRLPPPEQAAGARPGPVAKPDISRPAPKPAKPGFGGSGGSSGGNRPGFGGSGGSWQKPSRPPPVVRPPVRPPPSGNWGGSGGSWNDWNGRIVRCESWNYRYARCNLATSGGARLARVIAGDCRQGRTWGFDARRNFVWVNRGCRADFQGRHGSWSNGPSTGAVIAGVAVAAGLIAMLASKGRTVDQTATAQMASIDIGPGAVPAPADPSFRRCVEEAARQIGATGGTAIRLTGPVDAAPGNGAWSFQMPLEAMWPGDTHPTPAVCRASSSRVEELSFYQG